MAPDRQRHETMVREAYAKLEADDLDGLVAMCHDDMRWFIPGSTQVSGDHQGADAIREIAHASIGVRPGSFREELLDVLASDDGAAASLHQYLERDGNEIGYHVVHVWRIRNGKFAEFWEYPHEYDQFERAYA